jgi:hypothetical protein
MAALDALGVSPLGTPDRTQLHFPRLGRPVGLLARPARQVRRAHRHPRAIQTQVQRGRDLPHRGGHDLLTFVRGHRLSKGLGGPLHLFYRDGQPGQGSEELTAVGKADQRRRGPHHARDRGGERRTLQAQGPVTGTEPLGTGGAVVVGPRQRERPEGRRDGLRVAPGIPGQASTPGARQPRPRRSRGVGVEVLGQQLRGHREGLPPAGDLQRLEVEGGRYTGPEERRDLADGRCFEGRGEPPFCPEAGAAGAVSSASAQASQAVQ